MSDNNLLSATSEEFNNSNGESINNSISLASSANNNSEDRIIVAIVSGPNERRTVEQIGKYVADDEIKQIFQKINEILKMNNETTKSNNINTILRFNTEEQSQGDNSLNNINGGNPKRLTKRKRNGMKKTHKNRSSKK